MASSQLIVHAGGGSLGVEIEWQDALNRSESETMKSFGNKQTNKTNKHHRSLIN